MYVCMYVRYDGNEVKIHIKKLHKYVLYLVLIKDTNI